MTDKPVFDQAVKDLLDQDDEIRQKYHKQVCIVSIKQMVRSMRKSAGITQLELASRVGTTQSVISRLESSEPGYMPSLDTIIEIAHACNQRLLLGSIPMDIEQSEVAMDNLKLIKL